MALVPSKLTFLSKTFQSYVSVIVRSMAYKSSISLENLYPDSSMKLTTISYTPDPKQKYNGYIPLDKLIISYTASSGPGGQNVNKVHTKVDLRFKLSEALWLNDTIREKMLELHGKNLTKEGYLVIRSDLTRSQQLNLANCMQKLRNMIRDASITKREPSPETEEMIRKRHLKAARLRLAVKRESSLRRAERQPPTIHDL